MKAKVEQEIQIGDFLLKHLKEEGKNRFIIFPNKGYVPEGLKLTLRDPSTGEVITSSVCEGEDILILQTKPVKVPQRTEVILEVLGQEIHFYID